MNFNFIFSKKSPTMLFLFLALFCTKTAAMDADEVDAIDLAFAKLTKAGYLQPTVPQVEVAKKLLEMGYDEEFHKMYVDAGTQLTRVNKVRFNSIDLETAVVLQKIFPNFTAFQFECADALFVALGERNFDDITLSAATELVTIKITSFSKQQLETAMALQQKLRTFTPTLFEYAQAYYANVGDNNFDKRDLTAVQNILKSGKKTFTAMDIQAEKRKPW